MFPALARKFFSSEVTGVLEGINFSIHLNGTDVVGASTQYVSKGIAVKKWLHMRYDKTDRDGSFKPSGITFLHGNADTGIISSTHIAFVGDRGETFASSRSILGRKRIHDGIYEDPFVITHCIGRGSNTFSGRTIVENDGSRIVRHEMPEGLQSETTVAPLGDAPGLNTRPITPEEFAHFKRKISDILWSKGLRL